MFNNTRISILNSRFQHQCDMMVDIQGYQGLLSLDYGVNLPVSKRSYCSWSAILKGNIYFRIDQRLFKPILIKEWDSYLEFKLFELWRNNVVERVDELFDFFIYEWGENIKINDAGAVAVIVSPDNTIGEYDDKLIMVKSECKIGDIITYQEKKHLIFYPVEHHTNSYVGRIRSCNHRIAFNYTGDVEWFDVLIESKTFDIEEGKVISLPSGQIIVWLQENVESIKVALNQRFLNTGRAWQVTGIDRTKPGLMKLFCELTLSNADDDFTLGIADYKKYLHSYELSIANTQPVGVALRQTTQLIFVLKDNGTQVTTLPEITCTSSYTAIATVDNTGLITGVSNGTAAITALLTKYPDVKVNISVAVSGVIVPSYSIILVANPAEITLGSSFAKVVTATLYENGTKITAQPVTWSITNENGTATTKANISSYTDTTCSVKAPENYDNIDEVVVVTAALKSDSSVKGNISLRIVM
jgi:Bacterial Ig-like domain (group 2).